MQQRLTKSVTYPVILFTIVLVMIVALAIMWNVALVKDYNTLRGLVGSSEMSFHWGLVSIGIAFVVTVIVLLSVLLSQLVSEIRWNVRQSNFIASVTHELNSPLSSIKLYCQTLRGDIKPEDKARFVEIMLADVDRLGRMVGNVLRAAQLDQGKLPVHLEPVELHGYLRAYADEVGLMLQRRGRGDGIEALKGDPVEAEIDRTMFRQVLDNLIDNAQKYCKDGKTQIRLSVTREASRVVVDVRDDGIGIPLDELHRIFERFYRIEDPNRNRKGTGLGLWIVRSIVDAHGGTVSALSDGESRGATFRIELPLVGEGVRDSARAGVAVT
jgi:signal transduction histidine kinase